MHGVPAGMLGLEIVEESLRDVGATQHVLGELRELGVSLNLDDFGAGQSNLSWLQSLPITGIKIDPRFVASLDAAGDERDVAFVHVLIGLGHALGLSIVAEGVETEAQASALRAMGCELAQGYHFGYPGTPRELWASADAEASAAEQPASGGVARGRRRSCRSAAGRSLIRRSLHRIARSWARLNLARPDAFGYHDADQRREVVQLISEKPGTLEVAGR